jgi:hypothetical protein
MPKQQEPNTYTTLTALSVIIISNIVDQLLLKHWLFSTLLLSQHSSFLGYKQFGSLCYEDNPRLRINSLAELSYYYVVGS